MCRFLVAWIAARLYSWGVILSCGYGTRPMWRHVRGLGLAILLGAWFAPSTALGSCGDYVHVGSMPQQQNGGHSVTPGSSSPSAPETAPSHIPTGPTVPM